jgi:DNA (cytosine-5)-methyltransferase 1
VEEFDPAEILSDVGLQPGELDLLVGGPPCQAYSSAGKRGSVSDPRGTLIWQFLRFVDGMRPKCFLMENVRAIMAASLLPKAKGVDDDPRAEKGSVVKAFADDLRNLSGVAYGLRIFEVNSVNYGSPQIRERALFVGNRIGAEIDLPEPTHMPVEPGDPSGKMPWRTLRDAIGDIDDPDPVLVDFSPRKKHYLSMVPEGGNWRSLPEDIQRESMGRAFHAKGGRSGWWRRLSYDLPCPTLLTMPNHASTSLCHPTETRVLSVKEYAAVQEFPKGWRFMGNAHEQYRQIGNAVPTVLGRVAGAAIATALDNVRDEIPENAAPGEFKIIYIQSHIRTRSWFRDGKAVVLAEDEAVASKQASAIRTSRKHRLSV